MSTFETRTVAELAAALEEGVTVLDVRGPGEFASGHVPGARSLPLGELAHEAQTLPTDAPVWVICRSGGRSARAAELLAGRGVQAINVAGGTQAWRSAGHPVEPADAPPDWRALTMPLLASFTLGLAPFADEPHIVGKLRWVAGGAVGMGAMDWFDLVLHGAPWLWLVVTLVRVVARR